LSDVRKKPPVGESLEAVTHEHRPGRLLREVPLAADGQAVLTGDLERLRWGHLFQGLPHSSISPLMSTQPRNPRDIDATFS
jgi:hypothetical protein